LEYILNKQTVVETPSYIALAGKLFSEREREEIVAMVAEDPERGDVIRRPRALRDFRRREIGIPERAVGEIFGDFDEVHSGPQHEGAS